MATTFEIARTKGRNRVAGWWIAGFVILVVLGGGVYSIWLTNTTGSAPSLPISPPHATTLALKSDTDILQGNFVLQTALYRSPGTPVALIHFYRNALKNYPHQISGFLQQADSILPALAPEALQHLPPIFAIGNSQNANYFYTEYSAGQSDVGIAIDARNPNGPTLVYQEMLTQPSN